MCDTWQTADSDELFVMRNYNTEVNTVSSCVILFVQKTLKNANELLAVARSVAHDASASTHVR